MSYEKGYDSEDSVLSNESVMLDIEKLEVNLKKLEALAYYDTEDEGTDFDSPLGLSDISQDSINIEDIEAKNKKIKQLKKRNSYLNNPRKNLNNSFNTEGNGSSCDDSSVTFNEFGRSPSTIGNLLNIYIKN